MDVENFVAMTLEQIVLGVRRAQIAIDSKGGRVNPQVTSAPPGRMHSGSATPIQDIEFDIAVTVEERTKTQGELGVAMWAIKAGTGGASEIQNAAVSRIRFHVPLVLPRHSDSVPSASERTE